MINENNIKLPVIALGAWAWGSGMAGGDQVFGNAFTEEDLKPVFDAAIKAGLNLWDTAAVYGMGASEAILGKFIQSVSRENVIISTKFTPQISNGSETAMDDMFEESAERLGTDFIDIYWIHNPADVEKWTKELIALMKKGKIGKVGVSNHNLDEIKLANSILQKEGLKISAVQNHYSLLHRSSEDAGIIDYCNENDIIFFAYMVLEQGALSGKYDITNPFPEGSDRARVYNPVLPQIETLISSLKEIADKHDATVAQIAIAWAIAKHTLPIIGVTKGRQVEDAVKASKIILSQEEMNHMEELAKYADIQTIREWEKPMK